MANNNLCGAHQACILVFKGAHELRLLELPLPLALQRRGKLGVLLRRLTRALVQRKGLQLLAGRVDGGVVVR